MRRMWIHNSESHFLAYFQLPFLDFWEVVPRENIPILNKPVVGQRTPMFTQISEIQTNAMIFAVGDYETISAMYEENKNAIPTEEELTDPPNPVKYIMNERPPRKRCARTQTTTSKRRTRRPRAPPRLLGIGLPPQEPYISSTNHSTASTSSSGCASQSTISTSTHKSSLPSKFRHWQKRPSATVSRPSSTEQATTSATASESSSTKPTNTSECSSTVSSSVLQSSTNRLSHTNQQASTMESTSTTNADNLPTDITTHTNSVLSSNVQVPRDLYKYMPPQHVIPLATLLHVHRNSPNAGHFAKSLVKLLFPELFGPDQLRFKYNYHGGGIHGKEPLNFSKKMALKWYIGRFFPSCQESDIYQSSIIAQINKMLRCPERS